VPKSADKSVSEKRKSRVKEKRGGSSEGEDIKDDDVGVAAGRKVKGKRVKVVKTQEIIKDEAEGEAETKDIVEEVVEDEKGVVEEGADRAEDAIVESKDAEEMIEI
jgi:hypothetical protein